MPNRISDTARTEREAGKRSPLFEMAAGIVGSQVAAYRAGRANPHKMVQKPPGSPEAVESEKRYARAEAAAAIVKRAVEWERAAHVFQRPGDTDEFEAAEVALSEAVCAYNALAEG
mgnify:CR=1 FL=1